MVRNRHYFQAVYFLAFVGVVSATAVSNADQLQLKQGDHISYIGNTLADRMQHHGWLETYIQALHPDLELTFRNLGFPGDEVDKRPRSDNFGSADQWLTKTEASVIFCFFGYNEALRGEEGLPAFRKAFAKMIDGMLAQKYDGKTAPRIVVFSPIAHENLNDHNLPDGSANNAKLAVYASAMQEVCQEKDVRFVDLFHPTQRLYEQTERPLTMNGIHLLEHGNRAVAKAIVDELFGKKVGPNWTEEKLAHLRAAVRDKNLHWFSRYRVVDGYNVYGGRSKLEWFGQSNADVMKREMEIFDVKTANRDERVWAVARGSDLKVVDNNLPPEIEVRTNKPGELDGERHLYLGGKEAISKMTVAEGMQVNLFASEEMFPELVNPVQMAVDTDGRLFVSVWPSYPHWNPTQPRTDRIICLPDENRDGVADKCVIFADKLNSITGFEFWGGGMLVAAPPEIWFLKDTNGDDQADVKIRVLQGLSSADTHHSANAMLIGPDGWLYWSRGIFNVTAMETPTKTYRSTRSGVHRFNPRTFEMEFHFPIGPNPHGDVFDQWGYQFANDGTSGTGSYINIGKGIGNKQWFKKRVRPVAATGILSSGQFPERNNDNFLICNTIGFLGVLQHEVKYNGADITAEEIEPILVSTDQNFRPSDIEVGDDGGLYIADWCNVLIGHMQHNMRDPNRDHAHGRIYRVTHKDRPLLPPLKLKGQPIDDVLAAFHSYENGRRYRARLELSGRDTDSVVAAISSWTARLDPNNPADAQALLECLWVHEEHRVPNARLLNRVFQAADPRVRAAAIRTLGHWGDQVADWESLLMAAAGDDSALVRAEAVKAAVSFSGSTVAEAFFTVATRPTDPELDTVIRYASGQIDAPKLISETIQSGDRLSAAAYAYALQYATVDDLLNLQRTEEIYQAILARQNLPAQHLRTVLTGLAELRNANLVSVLLDLIEDRDRQAATDSIADLGRFLAEQPIAKLGPAHDRIEQLATGGKSPESRRAGFAAWIATDRSGNAALFAASKSGDQLKDFLEAIPTVADESVRENLYADVRSLVFELPPGVKPETAATSGQEPGINVDYYSPNPPNVARETLAALKPKQSGVADKLSMNVPQRKTKDQFALRFTGSILISQAGKYRFYSASDDGSRLYIGDELVVNNDGLHGMTEKVGTIELSAGLHPIVATYFDNGGGDGYRVSWSGPGFRKQEIPTDVLFVGGAESLPEVAIRALASIPGHEREKFLDMSRLFKTGQHRPAAVRLLRGLSRQNWVKEELPTLVNNLVGYLSEMPAARRTGTLATTTIKLTKALAATLPEGQQTAVLERLDNLDVRVIAIGTVPHRMIYDKESIAVQAGKPVEFRFTNTDNMPHNFAITRAGSLEEIGMQAEATARDADAMQRQYIPDSPKIMLASRLLQPGENQAMTFEAPTTPGVYPYVCTYPGHWRRMYGALYVVADLQKYLADPADYLAKNSLPLEDQLLTYINRNTEWKFDDLVGSVKPLSGGRSFDVAKNLFKVANCVGCHRMNNEGQQFGPDLTKLDSKKHTAEHILRSLLEPSKEIEEKYRSYTLLLESGKVVNGMILEESADEVKVLIDPLAKRDPLVIAKADIEERVPSKTSIMPVGLANKLTEEEVLDLIAYIYARGDRKHELFKSDHDH